MQTISASTQSRINAGAAPIIKAYKRRRGDFPALSSQIPVSGEAFFAAAMADTIVRFSLSTDSLSIRCQRIPMANLDSDWSGYSWNTICSGGPFGDNVPYQAFKIGSILFVAWVLNDHHFEWARSTDQGATWSSVTTETRLPIHEGWGDVYEFSDIHAVQELGVCIICDNKQASLFYVYNSPTNEFWFMDEGHGPAFSVKVDSGAFHLQYNSQYEAYEAGSFGSLANCTGTYVSKGYRSYSIIANATCWSHVYHRIFDTGASLQSLFRSDEGVYYTFDLYPEITAPIFHYASGYYYTANGEKLAAAKPESELPAVKSYRFANDRITIEWQSEPELSATDELVIRRGLSPDEMIALPAFITHHSEGLTTRGYCLPTAGLINLLAGQSNPLSYFLEILPALNGMKRPEYINLGWMPTDLDNDTLLYLADDRSDNIIKKFARMFCYVLAPRVDGLRFYGPTCAASPDFTVEALTTITPGKSIPNAVVVSGTRYEYSGGSYHSEQIHEFFPVNEAGIYTVVHHVDFLAAGDIEATLEQYYSDYLVNQRIILCRPQLALELGDTVRVGASMGRVVELQESYQMSPSLPWQQELLLADYQPAP